jgi:hypothetical protein
MYALAVDYSPLDDPGNIFVLGWSNEDDYYDTYSRNVYDILGEEPDSGLIDTGYGVFVYADRNLKFVEDEVEDAKREGIDVTIIKIDETDDEFDVTPVQ